MELVITLLRTGSIWAHLVEVESVFVSGSVVCMIKKTQRFEKLAPLERVVTHVNTGSDEHVTSRCVSWGMGVLMVIYYHSYPQVTGFHKRYMFISHLLKSSDPSS